MHCGILVNMPYYNSNYFLTIILFVVAVGAGGLMSQEVLDEIARISLAITKQIAVVTGVPDDQLTEGQSS